MGRSVMCPPGRWTCRPRGGNWPILPRPAALTRKTLPLTWVAGADLGKGHDYVHGRVLNRICIAVAEHPRRLGPRSARPEAHSAMNGIGKRSGSNHSVDDLISAVGPRGHNFRGERTRGCVKRTSVTEIRG